MLATLVDDLAATHERRVPQRTLARLGVLVAGAITVRGWAVIGFRLSHALAHRSGAAGSVVKQLTQALTGCDIAPAASIGPGLRLLHPAGVVVAADAVIGARCTIHQGVTIGSSPEGAPVLGDDVNLAPGSRVLGAVRIDDRCLIAANAVVTPGRGGQGSGVVYAGIPARVLREVRPDELWSLRG